jgi:hypothetical protein
MSIDIQSNASTVFINLEKKLGQALSPQNIDKMTREVAITTAANMRERIHEFGQAADNSQIGYYTDEYMNVRTGVYANSGVKKSVPNKGQPKNTGVYTKGKRKGQKRIAYNRGNDRRVIISLTRNFENDFTLGRQNKTPTKISGGYGIGWKNNTNALIAQGHEKRYRKRIWFLTEQEKKDAFKIAQEFVNNSIGKI